ncbi:MAG: hypothetical protein LC790_03375 [Actinobacteria bacterium]|nr:hypothetical protein [Actinomycetota bacterium]
MSVLQAEPEEVLLNRGALTGMALDELSVSNIIGQAARPNGKPGLTGGSPDAFAWMEPPPGVEPHARTRVQLSVEGSWGGSRLTAPAEVYDLPEGQLLRVVFYTLAVAIGRDGAHETLRWWLEPGGDDATLRADALDFLAGLHRGGVLSVLNVLDGRQIATVALEAQDFDPDLEQSQLFLNQVATLEEWSGARLPMPEEVDAGQATDIARAVAIVMARQVPLAVEEELTVTVREGEDVVEIDELRLPRHFTETLLGVDVPLGSILLSVGVIPVAHELAAEGLVRIQCRLAPDQPRRVTEHLYPPTSRSRVLRRTLVAGSPRPPRPDGLLRQLDVVRLDHLGLLLDEWEAEDGPVDPMILEDVRRRWQG